MARLIGYMANRRDRLRDAFRQERDAINGTPGDRRAWGIGFYQGDEVLYKKQPTSDGEPVDWDAVTRDVRTDCAIAHVRHATVGGFSVDNTHPFRFRQWSFAHVGTLGSVEDIRAPLVDAVPDYLRRNIRGQSDSELFFHIVLAALHETGHIENYDPDRNRVIEAIGRAVKRVDEVVGDDSSELNMLLTNGRQMYAWRRGGPFGYIEQTGLHDSVEPEGGPPPPGSPLLRYVMLVSGGLGTSQALPERYSRIEQSSIVVVDRELGIHRLPVTSS